MRESLPTWLRALPILAVLAACAPMLLHGYPMGHDWHLELVRVAEYREAWGASPRPPAWAGNLYGGFGAPVFLYYAPLFSALASGMSLVVGSVANGATLALVILMAVAAWGMHRLVRTAGGGETASGARVAAMLFVLNPYLLCDAMLRNAGAEFAALALAPLALLGVATLHRRPGAGVALLSAGLALTVVSHNLTAVVVAPALLVTLSLEGERSRIRLGASAFVLGLALCAFFWVPALAYQPLMRSQELLTGKFDFHHHFAGLVDIFGFTKFYAVGWLPAVCLLATAGASRRLSRGRERRWVIFCLAACAGCLFLVTEWSRGLWEHLPVLPLFQFPWRFLGPLALFAAVAAGLVVTRVAEGRPRRVLIGVEVAVFVLCLANAAPTLLRVRPLEPTPGIDLDRLDGDTIRSRGLGVTVRDEYLPPGADAELWRHAEFATAPILSHDPPVRISNMVDRPTLISFDVDFSPASDDTGIARLTVGRWNHPGWRLRIDGARATFTPNDVGTLGFEVPAGRSRIEIDYRGPPLRRVFVPVSAAALVLWGIIAVALPAARREAH